MLLRLVAVLFGLSQDVYISPGSGRCDMAGDDEAVAAVLALPADDDYVLAGPAVNVSSARSATAWPAFSINTAG
mgnify:CR=1 FL=1